MTDKDQQHCQCGDKGCPYNGQRQEKVDELPSSEFEAFQAWHVRYGPGFRKYSRLNEHEQRIAWQAWQARAALRSE